MAYQSFEIEIKNEVAAMSSENKQISIVQGQRRRGDFDSYDEDAEPAPPGFYMPQDPILENDEKEVRVFVEAKAKVKTTAAAIGRLLPIVGWGVAFIFLCLIISLVRPLLAFGLEYIAYAYAGGSLWLVLLGSIVLLLAVAFLLVGVFFLFNARGLFVSAEKILKDNFGDLVGLARDFCQLPKMEKLSKHIKEDELGETLRNYIKSFPPGEKYVASNGFSDEDAKFVKAFLDSRNDREKHGNSHFWIDEYKQFQLKQDTRAREVVSETCLMIGLKTAACPWKIVDMISVAFNSTIMITRIGRIYNRKTSKVSAFKLFCAFVFNMYVSGELGELFEEGARRVGEEAKKALAGSSMLSDSADNMSSIIVQTVPFLAKFAGKIAEGGVNAFFALRLGNRVIKNFQMLDK